MSGLRTAPEAWAHVETPEERQRRVGWNVLWRVAEQQLRRGLSCVLVARAEPIHAWRQLAAPHGAQFAVVESSAPTSTSTEAVSVAASGGSRVWYELEWERLSKVAGFTNRYWSRRW